MGFKLTELRWGDRYTIATTWTNAVNDLLFTYHRNRSSRKTSNHWRWTPVLQQLLLLCPDNNLPLGVKESDQHRDYHNTRMHVESKLDYRAIKLIPWKCAHYFPLYLAAIPTVPYKTWKTRTGTWNLHNVMGKVLRKRCIIVMNLWDVQCHSQFSLARNSSEPPTS